MLELAAVERSFGPAGREIRALGPLSLTVAEGEFVAVVGPSGCGKTTLLRLSADLLPPSAGSVRVFGGSAEQARRARAYGIVFQDPVLFDWRSAAGNVALPLEVAGVAAKERDERVAEALRLVGLTERGASGPWELSGGMQQRVALARALALRPRLLLMDEPFAALDELTRERLHLELLHVRAETGVTVLFVTHDIEEAVFLADRVVVLTPAPGRVAATIALDLPHPRHDDLRSEEPLVRHVARVRHALQEAEVGAARTSADEPRSAAET